MSAPQQPILETPPSVAGAPAAPRRSARSRLAADHPVLGFVLGRVAAGVASLLAVSVLVFLATNALPSNVADVVLGKSATPERVRSLEQLLHLDRPLYEQYLSWLGGLLHGDLGRSGVAVAESAPVTKVSSIISDPLINSIILAGCTAVLLVPLSLAAGVFAAIHAGKARDHAVSYGAIVFGALPEFVLGSFLILIFSLKLHWLPSVSLLAPGEHGFSNPKGLVLPVLTLLGVALAFTARQIRAGMLVALGSEHVKMARLNGLPERRVRWRYALRTAVAPSIQSYAQSLQYLFGGIIVVETLYAYPGIGTTLVQAVLRRDLPEVQSVTMVLAAAYLAINIAADLLIVFLVPRLRTRVR
jgi:peptide/nickel transport system permease protein